MKLKARPPTLIARDTRRLTPQPKTADSFYQTPEWRSLVARLIAERGRRCQQCGRTHDADGKPVRIFADHIRELRDGGARLDPGNIQLLDGACHTRKTLAERAKRMMA